MVPVTRRCIDRLQSIAAGPGMTLACVNIPNVVPTKVIAVYTPNFVFVRIAKTNATRLKRKSCEFSQTPSIAIRLQSTVLHWSIFANSDVRRLLRESVVVY
jgi:hypothetical protein